MAPKKPAITSKALQALLTRIGSASSGTKSTLLARFQRDVQRPGFFERRHGRATNEGTQSDKLRVVSIDMGIKNLAFCDAEVSRASANEQDFSVHMHVLRWKKLDLVGGTASKSSPSPAGDEDAADEESDQFSPSVLSRTAHRLIVEEVLSANPDVILIEKQRWRSGGGSAVQQWTVRVNTLEAMLWAILETVKQGGGLPPTDDNPSQEARRHGYQVHAVDPKRVGQYWLSQHALALQGRSLPAAALHDARESDTLPSEEAESATSPPAKKPPSRSKAEKSAKIALLRAWLAACPPSTAPSTPPSASTIAFSVAPAAEVTWQALLPKPKAKTKTKTKAARGQKAAENGVVEELEVLLGEDIPATAAIRKLDDVADCFLQAAAWVAWEGNRGLLLGDLEGGGKGVVDEGRVVGMLERCGGEA